MRIIDRYIVRSYLTGFLILISVGLGLYIVLDIVVNADEFTKAERPLSQVAYDLVDFYGYNLALYFSQLAGPMMAAAACFTLASMLRNNELAPLIAAGIPLQRLAMPVIIVSVLLTGVWLADRELLIPAWADKIARTRDDILTTRVQGVDCARDDNNAILTAQGLYPRERQLYRVIILEPEKPDTPPSLVQADAATWDEGRRIWKLQRGRRVGIAKISDAEGLGDSIDYEPLDEFAFSLSPEQLVLRRDSQWSDLMSITDLRKLLESRLLPNRAALELSFHVRATQPLLQIMLVLLALPAFLMRYPANILARGARALTVCAAFFIVSFLAHNLIQGSELSAFIAWTPVLLFGPFAVMQLAAVKT